MLVLSPKTTLSLNKGIVLHSLPEQDWYYAFSVVTGDQFRLNKTSFWILEEISNGIEWNVLKDNFLNTFEIPLEQAENDLKTLLDELFGQKIIRRDGNEKGEV